MKNKNRIFALLLSVMMVFTYMPALAFAEDEEPVNTDPPATEQVDGQNGDELTDPDTTNENEKENEEPEDSGQKGGDEGSSQRIINITGLEYKDDEGNDRILYGYEGEKTLVNYPLVGDTIYALGYDGETYEENIKFIATEKTLNGEDCIVFESEKEGSTDYFIADSLCYKVSSESSGEYYKFTYYESPESEGDPDFSEWVDYTVLHKPVSAKFTLSDTREGENKTIWGYVSSWWPENGSVSGDTISVTYDNNETEVYKFDSVIEAYCLTDEDGSIITEHDETTGKDVPSATLYEDDGGVGESMTQRLAEGDNDYYYQFEDRYGNYFKVNLNVVGVIGDVEFTYTPANDFVFYEGLDGYTDTYENSETGETEEYYYFDYNGRIPAVGDVITITEEGQTKEYTYQEYTKKEIDEETGEESSWPDFGFVADDGSVFDDYRIWDNQDTDHWDIPSANNPVYFTYKGVTQTIYVSVDKNPIESIEYNSSKEVYLTDKKTIFDEEESYEGYTYWWPQIVNTGENPDSITVKYRDDDKLYTYIAKTLKDEEDEGDDWFYFECTEAGNHPEELYVSSIYDEQYVDNVWEPGKHEVIIVVEGVKVSREVIVGETQPAESVEATDPTCTKEGNTAYWTKDGKYYSDAECKNEIKEGSWVVKALGHDYKEVAGSAKAATCTDTGKEADQKCSRCGDVKTGATIKAKGHTEQAIEAVAATCTAKGATAGKKCSVCGTVIEAPKEVAALGHDYKEVSGSAKEATCTEAGKEADQKCSRCSDVKTGAAIKAKGHTFGEWNVVKEATVNAEGLKERICSVCKTEIEKETLPITDLIVAAAAIKDAKAAADKAEKAAKDAADLQKAADEAAKTPGDAAIAAAKKAKDAAEAAQKAAKEAKEAADKADAAADKAKASAKNNAEKTAAETAKKNSSDLVSKAGTAVTEADKAVKNAESSLKAAEDAKASHIGTPEIKLSSTEFTYAYKVQKIKVGKKKKKVAVGTIQKPSVSVSLNGKAISADNYDVAYSNEESANIGTYTVTVTLKGSYSGKGTATYNINPKPAKISKPAKGKKKMTVKWKKAAKNDITYKALDGYEIQYSLSPDFSSADTKTTTASKKAKSKAIKKLQSKQTYYVRIRTYKNAAGVRLYSGWSAVKAVKVK